MGGAHGEHGYLRELGQAWVGAGTRRNTAPAGAWERRLVLATGVLTQMSPPQ